MQDKRHSTPQWPTLPAGWVIRPAIIGAATLLYALSFEPVYRQEGDAAGALLALPVTIAAVLYRVPGACLALLLGIPLTTALFNYAGKPGWDVLIVQHWTSLLIAVLAGLGVGWMSDLLQRVREQALVLVKERERLEKEIAVRRQAEEMLIRARAELDQRVNERTLELKRANEALESEIVERRRAEKALASEKERLAITLTSIGDGVITTDLNQSIQLFNAAAEKLTGWAAAEAAGKTLLDVFHIINRKTRRVPESPLEQVFATGAVTGLTEHTALIAKDGSERIISSSIAPIRDSDSRVAGAVLVFRDITQLKQAEEALRESQTYARNLIDSSLDMIIAVDTERKIVEFNRAAQETFSYRPEEILGKDVSILYADAEQAASTGQTMVESGRSVQEVFNRRKNGEAFPSFVSASVLRDAQGQPVGFMGISRDITERKLAEQQNIKAERLASLGRLSAALAHEMNNPLQAIRGTLDLVLDFPLEPEEREQNLAIIRQEIERLSQVTTRVLQFARPPVAPRRSVSIPQLVEQTLALARKQMEHARIAVTTDLQPLPPILAAPEELTQVFLNLILNAVEAMDDGGHLHIATGCEKNEAVVSFTNDGPLISPDVISHIFEPFFTTKIDGSGLGLSVSQGLIQQYGGEITVKNRDGGCGVVFSVRLPLVSEPTEQAAG